MILSNDTFRYYNGSAGLITLFGWTMIVCGFLIYLIRNKDDFLIFGPSEKIIFIGIKIDNWGKWALLMIYSTFSGISYTVIGSTIRPFVTNVIRDHKTPWNINYYYQSQSIVVLYNTYNWLTSILDMFVYLTCQIQFWIAPYIADVGFGIYFTHYQLTDKRTLYNEIETTRSNEMV